MREKKYTRHTKNWRAIDNETKKTRKENKRIRKEKNYWVVRRENWAQAKSSEHEIVCVYAKASTNAGACVCVCMCAKRH